MKTVFVLWGVIIATGPFGCSTMSYVGKKSSHPTLEICEKAADTWRNVNRDKEAHYFCVEELP